eukprot:CAMPEP_0201507464 /NCGR_PEP_ID=MMETSP0161_2-20130828/1117_1 /ASSEMBLY_ACC=CAM_ASM_000251 /TAXON_ID=180227 /ORGANISM="Neoparamoeba aestuarina, Strain SoJaBio B1-5/56/2" /LENGTH=185 /DNA_ID=CAMNT_0047901831 /DNA_START=38 /DNA_END=595 /DNA_ORIENTATION=-
MTKLAPLKWAQRDDRVFITFLVADATDVNIDFQEETIVFQCTSGDQKYRTTINLLNPIKLEEATYKVHGQSVACCVFKKIEGEEKQEPWERLTKEPARQVKHYVGIDWSLWKDDDEEAPGFPGMGNFDMSQFGNMGGMGGLGGMGGMDGMQGMGDLSDEDDDEAFKEEEKEEDAPATEATPEASE